MTGEADLWPPCRTPAELAAVESVPLSRRGLPPTTYALLERAATRWPDQPALTLLPGAARADEATTLSYAELASAVRRFANALTALGVRRPEAVALYSPNCGDLLIGYLAAQAVGLAAPINPALTVDSAEALLRRSGARVMLAAGPALDPAVWQRATELAARTGAHLLALRPDGRPTANQAQQVCHAAELAAAQPGDRLLAPPPTAEDLAACLHTGGTTGTPKLAAHTHANQTVMAWALAAGSPLDPGATVLGALPLFHANALVVTGLTPLFHGHHVVWTGPLGYRDPELYPRFWQLVERYRVAAMSAVPTVYAVLAGVPVDADISSLRLPAVGAAPLPAATRAAFLARTGLELCEGYGLTEATCACARTVPEHHRPGTVGLRLPYHRVRAVRVDPESGRQVDQPPGITGQLLVSGPGVFAGYLRTTPDGRPVPDPSGVVRDGWLDTGDLGSVDADGYLKVSGRAKDLIIRGGHNIDPALIEEALLSHPAVAEAAAVGRPDPHAGEVPVAFVSLHPSDHPSDHPHPYAPTATGRPVTPEQLRAWAAAHVPEPAAAPVAVHVLDALPHTEVGKVFKPRLREAAATEYERSETAQGPLRPLPAGPEGPVTP
ncbi:acyl-CoA synthetase [Kitasatospora sp. MMS16-BH015]|uniref:acyl-CoA synthetase n=1 Tax=Kitasatospora sp. MMS16-BH015 TaxID=2018025 RepID=UPI000CA0ABC5|nr:acyl-CoA synthetase [Kitasatospora sp. MMS16-BH015]AUG75288.1 acyl-CoA synthetase [Kitasatospora sp. MMS16-BH015]